MIVRLCVQLGRPASNAGVTDTLIFDMPMELGLEFMPVVRSDFFDAKWELVNDVLDGAGLGLFLVDFERALTCCIRQVAAMSREGSKAEYWKRRTFFPLSSPNVRNLMSIWI